MSNFTDKIDCRLDCHIPEGTELEEVPEMRRGYLGVIACPNENCGRCFLVVREP